MSTVKKYRYQILVDDLTRLIDEQKYKPHDLLPSYAELRVEYGLSIATITRAFDSMEKRGLIYSVQGKGTFVSPPVKSRKILILYPGDGFYRDSALFLDGAQKYLFKNNRAYLPILLPLNLVLEDPENITYIYPEIRGIIVFRDYPSFVTLESALKGQNISFLFYGSSMHKPLQKHNTYLYDEEEIARLIVEHLWERGYRQAGAVPCNGRGLGQYRYGLFIEAAEKRGLKVLPRYSYKGPLDPERISIWLKRLKGKGIPLYTSQGSTLLSLFYLILKAGLSLPDDVGLLGVDRIEISNRLESAPAFLDIPTSRDGQNCVLYLIDHMEGRIKNIKGTSPVSVIPGGTLHSF
jgi:DNA-binding LacI/PurR family transcriptional regulator